MRARQSVTAAILAIAAVASSAVAKARADDFEKGFVKSWISTFDATKKLEAQKPIRIESGGGAPAGIEIRVDDSKAFQAIEGFGASFTDSSSWLINRKMSSAQRIKLLEELFSRVNGIGLSLTRVPLGASDFSLEHYSFDDMPAGQTDETLRHFSIAKARADVLPQVRAARKLNPDLKVFVSPWSAPGWMKTGGSLIQGKLDPRYYHAYARYFDRTLHDFNAAGVPVYALTMQNEPHFEPPTYPGMRVPPAERAAFIGGHLGPLLAKNWPTVRILDWDHNWDEPQSPLEVLADPQARKYITGVAWHCYGGDVSAQGPVREKYPEKEVWMTECSGGNWAPDWGGSLVWMAQNLIIGNLRNYGRGAILWNLALDENSAPHLGGCDNCRGVVTINSQSGEVTRNVEYFVLAHASRFVRPGARRIASDSDVQGIHTVAMRDPRDNSRVLIAVNTAKERRNFTVVEGSHSFKASLDAGAVATYVWIVR